MMSSTSAGHRSAAAATKGARSRRADEHEPRQQREADTVGAAASELADESVVERSLLVAVVVVAARGVVSAAQPLGRALQASGHRRRAADGAGDEARLTRQPVEQRHPRGGPPRRARWPAHHRAAEAPQLPSRSDCRFSWPAARSRRCRARRRSRRGQVLQLRAAAQRAHDGVVDGRAVAQHDRPQRRACNG